MGTDYEIWALTPSQRQELQPNTLCENYEKGIIPPPNPLWGQAELDRFEECATTRNFGYDYETNKGYNKIYLNNCSLFSKRTQENCLEIKKRADELENARKTDRQDFFLRLGCCFVFAVFAVLGIDGLIQAFSAKSPPAKMLFLGKGNARGISPGPLNPSDFML